MPRAALAAIVVALLAPAAARAEVFGHSVEGRALTVQRIGPRDAPVNVLVTSSIHGNETAGQRIIRRLARLQAPQGVRLWLVRTANPDGVAAGTRQNGHRVDLNRNFPFRWRPLDGVFESGPHALSEREARIGYDLIRRLHPSLTIWFHQHRDLVWASGGDRRIERVFARASGLPYRALPALDGSAIDWQNHALPGTTAFAAELPAGAPESADVARYARAVLVAGRAS